MKHLFIVVLLILFSCNNGNTSKQTEVSELETTSVLSPDVDSAFNASDGKSADYPLECVTLLNTLLLFNYTTNAK